MMIEEVAKQKLEVNWNKSGFEGKAIYPTKLWPLIITAVVSIAISTLIGVFI